MLIVLLAVAGASAASGSERLLAYFTPEDVARGNAYMHGRYWLYAAGIALRLGVLSVLILTPASAALRSLAVRLAPGHPTLAVAVYLAILLVGLELLVLPLAYYSGFLREHAFGLSTQTAGGWLLDRAKGALVSLLLGVPVGVLLVTLWRKYPGRWVLPAWGLAAATTVLLVALAPVVIDPLFNTIRPLPDALLRSRVLLLAQRAGVPVSEVYESDASRRTRKGNAYFTGLGATKRIVLYDTLVRGSRPEEVELILAHEMGHWKHGHIWQGLLLSVAALGVALWAGARALEWAARRPGLHLAGPADVAGLPVFLLTVYLLSLLSLPLQTAISRHFERQADRASLVLTRNPAAFISAEVSLARSNLADLTPPAPLVWLLYTHPPVLERIRMAEEFRTAMTDAR
jgi:STE24 endopeptidase